MNSLSVLKDVILSLSNKFVDREEEVLALTSSLVLGKLGANMLLIGYPGTAKSSLVKEFCRTLNLSYGELVLTPTMLPSSSLYYIDQIKLIKENKVEVNPSSLSYADIAFLDEIGRANDIMLHSILSYLLDREFFIDQITAKMKTRTLTVVGATNFVNLDSKFDAVYDRFTYSIVTFPPSSDEFEAVYEKGIEILNRKLDGDGDGNVEVIPITVNSKKPKLDREEIIELARVALSEVSQSDILIAKKIYSVFNMDKIGENRLIKITIDELSKPLADIFKKYVADREVLFPVKSSMRKLQLLPPTLALLRMLGYYDPVNIAKAISWFFIIPDEQYFPLYIKSREEGISILQKKILNIIHDLLPKVSQPTYNDKMLNEAEMIIRFLSNALISIKKIPNHVKDVITVESNDIIIHVDTLLNILSTEGKLSDFQLFNFGLYGVNKPVFKLIRKIVSLYDKDMINTLDMQKKQEIQKKLQSAIPLIATIISDVYDIYVAYNNGIEDNMSKALFKRMLNNAGLVTSSDINDFKKRMLEDIKGELLTKISA
jgi:MoxR-like ATPase